MILPLVMWGLMAGEAVRAQEELGKKLGEAVVEQYVQSPAYADAPVWRTSLVYFASSAFWRVQEQGPVKVFDLNPSGACVRDGEDLLLCETSLKSLLNVSADGKVSVLADQFEGQPLNSLNDVTIDAQGRIYWTDPVGSSREKPIGKVLRLTPDGTVSVVIEGLAFPAGVEVDPTGKTLMVVESQTHKILKYSIPEDGSPFGMGTPIYDVGGSGGDGCAFDASGNLWIADFHQKETGRGRLTVISGEGALIGHVAIPAKVVSNVAFGGAKFDEVFCTTAEPPGVFRVQAGTAGFAGHRAAQVKPVKELDIKALSGQRMMRTKKVTRQEKRRQRAERADQKLGDAELHLPNWSGSWRVVRSLGAWCHPAAVR